MSIGRKVMYVPKTTCSNQRTCAQLPLLACSHLIPIFGVPTALDRPYNYVHIQIVIVTCMCISMFS